jgi:chromosomal replication initiator protein
VKNGLRNHLLQTCSESELQRWYDPIKIDISDETGEVVVTFPHAFFGNWFKNSIQSRFEEQLSTFLGKGFKVSYSNNGQQNSSEQHSAISETPRRIDFPFGHTFTFDNFIISKKNFFPLASAKEVARLETVTFNPFVICGKNGSGKSHMMKAIANEISKRVETDKIFLGNMDDIKTIYSVKFSGDNFKARNYFFSMDYIFVDDFQSIRKYDELQQEMISIFNNFYENEKQMVFCCNDKLVTYDFLNQNLKSRLEWGLIVTLKRPDLEIRTSFIQKQCKIKKLQLSKEQILTLSQKFQDFRYLQGILIKLLAFKELVRKNLDQKDFEHILNNTEEKTDQELTPEYILQAVSEHFNVSTEELKGNKRLQSIVRPRQMAMYLCRHLLGVSFSSLGRIFGGKDHSTVLYSVKKIDKLQKVNKETKDLLITLENKCRGRVPK